MSVALPPGVEADDEIAMTWERNEDGVKIVASLGEASITVEASYDATETLPWLVGSLPAILNAAYDAIEARPWQRPGRAPNARARRNGATRLMSRTRRYSAAPRSRAVRSTHSSARRPAPEPGYVAAGPQESLGS